MQFSTFKNLDYHPELIKAMTQGIAFGTLVSNIFGYISVGLMIYDYVPLSFLYICFVLNIIIYLMRVKISKEILRQLKTSNKDFKNKLLTIIVLNSITALIYGVTLWVSIIYNTPDHNLFVVIMVMILFGAGATSTMGSIFHVFALFFSIMTFSMILAVFYHGGEIFTILGYLLFVFWGLHLASGHKQYIALRDAILLRETIKNLNTTLEEKIEVEIEKNRQKEQKLLQHSRLAQMGEMISMIAHQWRQPLGAISTTAVNLKLKLQLETFDLKSKKGVDEAINYFLDRLQKIDTYVRNLTLTIDDFRNFYKPNKESVTLRLQDIILKSLNVIEASLISHNIKVVQEYNDKKEIELYDNEMMQVVLNILKNAQDNFTERNIKDAYIKITTQDTTISICDNGGGIDKKILDKIYDPYYSTKSEKNGTGLGLYMSKIIIQDHHRGTLSAINTKDGVCFMITIGKVK